MHLAYLSLGSNIHPEINIPRALQLLSNELTLIQTSSAWCTAPVGTPGPSFVNLAVQVSTPLGCMELKTAVLQRIESQLGRVRTKDKFAPRPIDIDIILFDDLLIEPSLAQSTYLVLPLAELIPSFTPPGSPLTLEQMSALASLQRSATRLDNFPHETCD